METNFCGRCGTRLGGSARVRGSCPRCLMRLGLETGVLATGGGETVAAPTVEEISAELPQYEILERVGRGGMGAVYRARQKSLERVVALKVLLPTLSRDPSFASRFLREAQALAGLRHPGIVDVYDFGQAGDYSYFAMEYVDGVNLREMMRDGNVPVARSLGLVGQICEALQAAHEQDVVHRDIKPENILVDASGSVKVTDFGLAKLTALDGPSLLTRTDQVMGTLHYMAPEQVERPQEVDRRADLYSVGVLLYELLTGELPIGRFPPPSRISRVDARLDGVVLRALEKSPDHRYQSAQELGRELERIATTPPAMPMANARPGRLPPVTPVAGTPPQASHGVLKTVAITFAVLLAVFGLLGATMVFLFVGARSETARVAESEARSAERAAVLRSSEVERSRPDAPVATSGSSEDSPRLLVTYESVESPSSVVMSNATSSDLMTFISDDMVEVDLSVVGASMERSDQQRFESKILNLRRRYLSMESEHIRVQPSDGVLLSSIMKFGAERGTLVEELSCLLSEELGCDARDEFLERGLASDLFPLGRERLDVRIEPGPTGLIVSDLRGPDGMRLQLASVKDMDPGRVDRSMTRVWTKVMGADASTALAQVSPQASVRASGSARSMSFAWGIVILGGVVGVLLAVGLVVTGVTMARRRHRRMPTV